MFQPVTVLVRKVALDLRISTALRSVALVTSLWTTRAVKVGIAVLTTLYRLSLLLCLGWCCYGYKLL